MKLYRDVALVIRRQDLGEADRIITLLTRSHGKVRGVAKGIRRTKSRFGGRLELGNYVDVQLYRGKNLDSITEVVVMRPYAQQLMNNYSAYTSAHAMCELIDRIMFNDEDADVRQFNLLHGAMNALAKAHYDSHLLFNSYVLRSMALAGWALSIDTCAECASPSVVFFDVRRGGMLCGECGAYCSLKPRRQTLTLLSALFVGNWDLAMKSSQQSRNEVNDLVNAHMHWHMERSLRSLSLLEG
ncbi:MAG: DNA repair protein RecO [Actinomycetaceae bacterium]|nr:DNA repair protein RecO [Actinomycetaceae bacterium]